MIARLLKDYTPNKCFMKDRFISVGPETDLQSLPDKYPWLNEKKLVVKPDLRFKRRCKNNLILLDSTWPNVKNGIQERLGKPITIGNVTGVLTHFIVEPFVSRSPDD